MSSASMKRLVELQIQLEEEATYQGMSRYFKRLDKVKRREQEETTCYGKEIIRGRIEAYTKAIEDWKEKVKKSPGRLGLSYIRVKDVDSKFLAYLALKNVIGGITKVRTLQHVAIGIGTAIEDELRMQGIRKINYKQYEAGLKKASLTVGHKYRRAQPHYIGTAIDDGWVRWTTTERCCCGVKLIEIMINSVGLISVGPDEMASKKSLNYVKALPDTLEWIGKRNDVVSVLRPVYEPMIVPPKDWTNPFNGGYLSNYIKPITLVKTANKNYLRELKHVDMPVVYDAVNGIQRTAWRINTKVLDVIKTLWERGGDIAKLPPRFAIELPDRPEEGAPSEDPKVKAYRRAASRVHSENMQLNSVRSAFLMHLDIAERYSKYDKIYFPYQLDFRGRVYAVPLLNPQGADYMKALLTFGEGKPLGAEGWKWLAIHGANLAGFDKVSFEDRVNWVFDNEEEILRIAEDPLSNKGWFTEIGGCQVGKEKPFQFLAFCFEWAGFVREGEDYVASLPVALDGSCSGIQHFSAMLRDEIGGYAVNLVPQDKPADVYKLVCDKVIEQLNIDLKKGTEDSLKHNDDGEAYVCSGTKSLAKQWLAFGVSRKTTKRSVMTLAYGSKQYGFKEQLLEDILFPAYREARRSDLTVDRDKYPFDGVGNRAAAYMADLIWKAVNKVLVKASEAMAWLQSAANLASSEGLPICWTTPIGFPVMQAYKEFKKYILNTSLNGRIELSLNIEKEGLDKRKQSQGISPNFVHANDASHLMLTVTRAKQKGVHSFSVIHDSFGTLPTDMEILYHIVRSAFVEMYTEIDVLEEFRNQLAQQIGSKGASKLKDLPEFGNLSLDAIRDSRYCFA